MNIKSKYATSKSFEIDFRNFKTMLLKVKHGELLKAYFCYLYKHVAIGQKLYILSKQSIK